MVSDGVNGGEDAQERRRRAVLGLLAIAAVIALVVWWLLAQMVVVPDITGLSQAEAGSRLEAAGLVSGEVVSVDASDKEVPGTVVQQTPAAGDRLPKGSKIGLVLAKAFAPEPAPADLVGATAGLIDDTYLDLPEEGRETDNVGLVPDAPPSVGGPTVPLVLRKSAADAKSILSSAGYGMKLRYAASTTTVPKGLAMRQDPAPGAREALGTLVTVWISTGHPK